MKAVLAIPILLILTLGISLQEVEADLVPEEAYLLEGFGFAVTEDVIKNSQIDFLIDLDRKIGSTTKLVVEDGFVTLGNMEFNVADITGSVLRDGHFIRLAGTADDSLGNQVTLSAFGRLIEDSQEGSVYSFTGRLSEGIFSNKIIYTTKISSLRATISDAQPTITSSLGQIPENGVIVHILKNSANPEELDYIERSKFRQFPYYSEDRITIEPGTTITWINDDVASHSISSGTGLGSSTRASQGAVKICDESQLQTFESDPGHGSSGFSFKSPVDPVTRVGTGCTFTMDGRIKSGEILPGESWSVTIEEPGFYRLADVDYIWMNIIVYAFPDVGSQILPRTDANPLN